MPTAVSCLPPALSRALVGALVCFVLWLPGEALSQERSAAPPGSSEAATESSALSVGFAELVRHRSDDPEAPPAPGVDPHTAVFQTSMYPSAAECAACHQAIYDEWSSSSHAYSAISPMFNKFEQRINDLSQGTIGFFCMRCHASVGTTMGESRDLPLWERSQVSREGVTCITCHRVDENFGRVNGERRIVPGTIYDPVFGPTSGQVLEEIIGQPGRFPLITAEGDPGPGQDIHGRAIRFEQLDRNEFCVSCHQVAVNLGIKLEIVWDQYRASPARTEGITCQDCHMGLVPGVPSGYATGPAAVVAGVPINPDRKRTNHMFYGPGYPTTHPGIFPHQPRAQRWGIDEWLRFDYRAGWGTPEFEDALDFDEARTGFPEVWSEPDDRFDAREIIEENLVKLEFKRETRRQVMENGMTLDGPFFNRDPRVGQGLGFTYTVTNTNSGHNLPSGSLGAQPELWLNVVLTGPDGDRLWESGHVDSHGDMADLHSLDVRAGLLEPDHQLFNLQTKFLIQNVKGTDREMNLPINVDVDQLPFLRPAGQPVSVINHPPGVRMESRSIPPLASRDASYSVPGNVITRPGTYRLSARLRSRAQPIYFMRFVFATEEMERDMNYWMLDLHTYTVEFEVR
jgi:hypothetical protein